MTGAQVAGIDFTEGGGSMIANAVYLYQWGNFL